MTGSVFRDKDTNPDRAQTLPGFLFDGELTDSDEPAKKIMQHSVLQQIMETEEGFCGLPQTRFLSN